VKSQDGEVATSTQPEAVGFVVSGHIHWTLAAKLRGIVGDRLMRAVLRLERAGKLPGGIVSRWNGGLYLHHEKLGELIASGDLHDDAEQE
jgi:hypothetical protein